MNNTGAVNALKLPLWGLFFFALFVVVTIAKTFFLPVLLALLLALTLSPVVRYLRRRGVPEVISALLLVTLGALFFAVSAAFLVEPFSEWIEQFPSMFIELKYRFSGLLDKIAQFQDATLALSEPSGSANRVTTGGTDDKGNGLVLMAANNILRVATTTLVTTVLTFFLLANGRVFYSKVLEGFSKLKDKKSVLSTVYTIEQSISRYLFSITVINVFLGIAIAVAMWLMGMPNPVLWGIAATVLNFLPYIGALMGIIASGVVAILTFDGLANAFIVPVVYTLLTGLEGQFITPSYIGRSLAINPVIIFLSVALWSYMWGLAGALIAVPLLVVAHQVALNIEQLSWFAHFISDYEIVKDD